MKTKWLMVLVLVLALAAISVLAASAVSGAAYTTFNAAADGAGKDVCKNSAINCNIYGDKTYVWLNGGPTANGLGPAGEYFFVVLAPGGQPNPNDGGPKNLSDDFDAYTNRTFTVGAGGEVIAYSGTHDFDSGTPGNPKVDGQPPYIRLFPYADTTNPGGVYIMAICSLAEGYPVDPRDCKYDAFKAKKGKLPYQFMLSGMKFEDMYADGVKDPTDPGLPEWTITIKGTGPDGQPIDASVVTGAGGYWEWLSPEYWFTGANPPLAVNLQVCEVVKPNWYQSYPTPACYTISFTPVAPGFDSFYDLDFGNWRPVTVTGCKEKVVGTTVTPKEGWLISLTKEGVVVDTKPTGADGCYTWTGLKPGFSYDLHEETRAGWKALGPVDVVFAKAKSGDTFSHTFQNTPLEGCTPGFWQGGNDFGTAGGKWLWNEVNDPQWIAKGGQDVNPYIWDTGFCSFFGCSEGGTMWYYVNPDMWSVNNDFHKAARSLTAAYLNASWGIGYAYSTTELKAMWTAAYNGGTLLALHNELDAANNAYYRAEPPPHCPISADMK